MSLTELQLKHLKPKDKLYRVSDDRGLIIEVTPNGSKLWRWRFSYQGKGQMLALGKYPAVTLAQARRARDAAYAMVDIGKHPLREKKIERLRNMHNGDNSFENIARRWLDDRDGYDAKYNKQCLSRLETHVFPLIGMLPIAEISIPDVFHVVEKIGKGGTVETAKRMKQIMSQVFRYASHRGLCTGNPASDLRGVLPTTAEKHFACIHPRELPEFLQAMEAREDDLTKSAMKLLALTFVRTGELIAAKWEEIDWEREEWNIPQERMKMKRPHVVPLCTQALALLRDLQGKTGNKTFIFFSAASKHKHISNGAVLMALRRMGYKNRMTGHGFRTLASTILNEKGYAPDVIERQLAHQETDKIRGAYNRAEYMLERKKMMQDYADFLERVQKEPGKNVLAMSKARKA